jgi:hypothetical protein
MNRQVSRDVLEDMVWQFGYRGQRGGRLMICTGGLSVLEDAFSELGWTDPHLTPELECAAFGCFAEATCGVPTLEGYKRFCGRHYREATALPSCLGLRTIANIVAGTGGSKAAEPLHDAIHRVEREIADEKEPNRG